MWRAAATSALGVLLLAAAVAFDTASLYVPGVALAALALGAVAWVSLAAHGAGVERTPGPHTVVEGEPYPLRLVLRPGLLAPPAGELRDPLLERPIAIGGWAPRRVRTEIRFARRGRRLLEPAALIVRDPLAIAVREIAGAGAPAELLVLPRTEAVVVARRGGGVGAGFDDGARRAARRGRADGSAAELDLEGLRPYREGAPASRIHWPAFARSGEMLERRLTSEADSAPLVVLDATGSPSQEALDRAVRAAASLCLHLARRGGCALLLPGERRPLPIAPDLAAWPAAHARLALVAPFETAPALARLRRSGAVLWVGARPDPPRALARLAPGGGFAVTPLADDGAVAAGAAFTVAGCAGRRLGRPASARAA
jgi:uncharacterized protein (DUF58 family)